MFCCRSNVITAFWLAGVFSASWLSKWGSASRDLRAQEGRLSASPEDESMQARSPFPKLDITGNGHSLRSLAGLTLSRSRNFPARSEFPNLPEQSEWPDFPDQSEFPDLPDQSEWPDFPDRSQFPDLPDQSEWPDFPDRSEFPNFPDDDDDSSDSSDFLNLSDSSDSPDDPEIIHTSDFPESIDSVTWTFGEADAPSPAAPLDAPDPKDSLDILDSAPPPSSEEDVLEFIEFKEDDPEESVDPSDQVSPPSTEEALVGFKRNSELERNAAEARNSSRNSSHDFSFDHSFGTNSSHPWGDQHESSKNNSMLIIAIGAVAGGCILVLVLILAKRNRYRFREGAPPTRPPSQGNDQLPELPPPQPSPAIGYPVSNVPHQPENVANGVPMIYAVLRRSSRSLRFGSNRRG